MFNLPTESQLDIFKFLDFDQIFQFQQINNTFLKIINEYKKEFSRKEFETISMVHCISAFYSKFKSNEKRCKIIDLEIPSFYLNKKFKNFPSAELREKWQTAINKQIPLYANEPNNEYYIQLLKKENVTPRRLILNLPNIPKNIEEMLIIRFWLEELSFCIFENFEFQVLFNPELIKLLFEENPINFHSQKVFIKFKNKNVKKVLNSAMDNLMVYKYVIINFGEIWNNEDYNEEVFKLILNGKKKFNFVVFELVMKPTLHNMLLKHIETSTNFSNMIPKITFNEICWDRSKLSERAENIKSAIKDGKLIFEKYQLSNINNPKIKFSINKKIRDDGRIIKIEIKKIRG
ncbi:hypothetical protein ACQ4LE_005456 [Meloidogyne hapla]